MSLVSVITPVYNAAQFLPETYASLCAQSFSDWQWVVAVDPRTSDKSLALLRSYQKTDGRVVPLLASRSGAGPVRNHALEKSQGRYLAFLDADDLWLPKKMEKQIEFMREHRSTASATGFRRINVSGEKVGRLIAPPARIDRVRLLQNNCILCSSVMLDTRSLESEIRFGDGLCEDYGLWLKLTQSGMIFHGLAEDLVRYRIVPHSRGANKLRSLYGSWQALRDEAHLPLPRAVASVSHLLLRNLEKYSRF